MADAAPAQPKRPRRACTLQASPVAVMDEATATATTRRSRVRPTNRILIIHANGKPYGHGPSGPSSDDTAVGTAAVKAKASNRLFQFSCRDYEAMRDSGLPYSGDPRVNKLLPLPRPTYTEFINRVGTAVGNPHLPSSFLCHCAHTPCDCRAPRSRPSRLPDRPG